jgi:hypothetical protein
MPRPLIEELKTPYHVAQWMELAGDMAALRGSCVEASASYRRAGQLLLDLASTRTPDHPRARAVFIQSACELLHRAMEVAA